MFITIFFFYQVAAICGGSWRETGNSRVSYQQEVQYTSLILITVISLIKMKLFSIVYQNVSVSSAWLKGSAQSTVGKLDKKISALTGLNVSHPYGEYLQVVNYGIGGHYEPHFDHATVSLF